MSHEAYQDCIDACCECAAECEHCFEACLKEKEIAFLTGCIKLTKECAAICLYATGVMGSGSDFAAQTCQLCADVCEACAAECEKHSHLAHCKTCAEVCRRCAEACKIMSGGPVVTMA